MSAAGLSPSLARSLSLSLSNTLICLSLSLSFCHQGTTDAEPLGCHGEGATNVPADCRATWQRFVVIAAKHFGL